MKRRDQSSYIVQKREFIDILEEEFGTEYVRELINRYSPWTKTKTLREALKCFQNIEKYFSKMDRKRIIKEILATNPDIKSMFQAKFFLDNTKEYLSDTDIIKFLEDIPINSMNDVKNFFTELSEYVPNLKRERMIKQMLPAIQSKKDLKKLKDYLSLSFLEYRKALKAVRTRMRNSSEERNGGRMARRLKCLRQWISEP